jgi:hypothetical protein
VEGGTQQLQSHGSRGALPVNRCSDRSYERYFISSLLIAKVMTMPPRTCKCELTDLLTQERQRWRFKQTNRLQ